MEGYLYHTHEIHSLVTPQQPEKALARFQQYVQILLLTPHGKYCCYTSFYFSFAVFFCDSVLWLALKPHQLWLPPCCCQKRITPCIAGERSLLSPLGTAVGMSQMQENLIFRFISHLPFSNHLEFLENTQKGSMAKTTAEMLQTIVCSLSLFPLHIPVQFLSSQEIFTCFIPTNCCVLLLKQFIRQFIIFFREKKICQFLWQSEKELKMYFECLA